MLSQGIPTLSFLQSWHSGNTIPHRPPSFLQVIEMASVSGLSSDAKQPSSTSYLLGFNTEVFLNYFLVLLLNMAVNYCWQRFSLSHYQYLLPHILKNTPFTAGAFLVQEDTVTSARQQVSSHPWFHLRDWIRSCKQHVLISQDICSLQQHI